MLGGAPAMSFNEDRQLDPSQVEDLRGRSPLTHGMAGVQTGDPNRCDTSGQI
jgi:hypothetical protein